MRAPLAGQSTLPTFEANLSVAETLLTALAKLLATPTRPMARIALLLLLLLFVQLSCAQVRGLRYVLAMILT